MGREAGGPLRTGVCRQFFLAGNRVAALHLATRVFLAGKHIVTSNGIKNRKVEEKQKSMRQEATKFEKFKRRKSREKPRKEKRNFQ